jgi:hypothetical protein
MGKLDRCNDRKICGKLPVNETVETPTTCLSVDYLELKTDRMSNKLKIAYHISCEIYIPYAGEAGILLHR